jgi:hypothetical protein
MQTLVAAVLAQAINRANFRAQLTTQYIPYLELNEGASDMVTLPEFKTARAWLIGVKSGVLIRAYRH